MLVNLLSFELDIMARLKCVFISTLPLDHFTLIHRKNIFILSNLMCRNVLFVIEQFLTM